MVKSAATAILAIAVLIGAACGAQVPLNAGAAPVAAAPAAAKMPSLMSIAKQMFADREGAVERQAVEQDSYLEALEYSQNSAALQGEGGGISGFFRSIQNAVSDVGFSRAGIAAAVAVPLVAIGGLALLSPLVLGRKRRDLDGLEESKGEPDAVDRLRARVTDIYTDVTTSDECIERLVCELGAVAKDVYYKDSVIRVMNYFAPSHYKKYLSTLKSAAYTGDTSKCRQIKCTPIGL